MHTYAVVAGLRPRIIVRVPVLTPPLSGHWVAWSPGAELDRPPAGRVAEGRVVAAEHDIAGYLPDPPEGLSASTPRSIWRSNGSGTPGGHPLVVGLGARRALRPAAHRPRLGRWQPLRGRGDGRWRLPEAALAGGRGHRRRPAGTPSRWPGGSAACSTGSSAGRAAARPAGPGPGLRRRDDRLLAGRGAARRASCCGCAPRCGCRGWPGWSSAWNRIQPAARPRCGNGRSSTRAGCSGMTYWWAVAPFHGIVFGGMIPPGTRAAEAP